MKEIKNIYAKFIYEPLNQDEESVFCKCGLILVFNKNERLPFETVKIYCPSCGCKIIYG